MTLLPVTQIPPVKQKLTNFCPFLNLIAIKYAAKEAIQCIRKGAKSETKGEEFIDESC